MPPDELRLRLKRMAAVPGYQPPISERTTSRPTSWPSSNRTKRSLPELDTITVHRRLVSQERIHGGTFIGYVGSERRLLTQPQLGAL